MKLAILVGSVISMAILAACSSGDSQDETTAVPPVPSPTAPAPPLTPMPPTPTSTPAPLTVTTAPTSVPSTPTPVSPTSTPTNTPAPAATPTPTPPPQPSPTTAPTPTPEPTPMPRSFGSVVAADTVCPPGSREASQCREVVVTCPDVSEASAQLRLSRPTADVTHKGTIVLTTGGPGTFSYYGSPEDIPGKMVDTFVSDGLVTVDIQWEEPGIWEGNSRATTLACRYATVSRWIYDNLHEGGEETLYVAQGNSGGAAQIAFGLAHYGLDEIIDLANLGGGPPACPRCAGTGAPDPSREPLLAGNPQLNYPSTTVRFFLGENEPTQYIIDNANEYFNSITSEKTMQIVPNTEHSVQYSGEGAAVLIAAVRDALEAQ